MIARFATLVLCAPCLLFAQVSSGFDTLYGTEWIRYEQSYLKMEVARDGLYRIPADRLIAAGWLPGQIEPERYQLFVLGEEVPLYASSDGPLRPGDYLEFYGRRNRGQLDRYLYEDPDTHPLNPAYSLYTDTAAYFLTAGPPGTRGLRYESLPNAPDPAAPPEPWLYRLYEQVFASRHHQKPYPEGVRQSFFEPGDGFASPLRNRSEVVWAPTAPLAAGTARLRLRLLADDRPHQWRIQLNGQPLIEDAFEGWGVRSYELTFTPPAAAEWTLAMEGLASGQDRHALAWLRLRYPAGFNLAGADSLTFVLPEAAGPRQLQWTGAPPGEYVLLDFSQGLRMEAEAVNGQVRFRLPEAAGRRSCWLGAEVVEIQELETVHWIDFRSLAADYILLTHPHLRGGGDPVAAYADYRRQEQAVLVVDIRQLYDQFAYGLRRHPLAVRHFAHYIRKHWPEPPGHFFLLGKAIEYPALRLAGAEEAEALQRQHLLPTFGSPGSDVLLLGSGRKAEPLFAVGRLAATRPEEVWAYLDKVRAFEATGNLPQTVAGRAWLKRVLHLGGGDLQIQGLIRNHLEHLGDQLAGSAFGAEVISFYKTSSEPVQLSTSGQLLGYINSGTRMLTFFGHSGGNTFDFSLDDPETYANADRYPFILSLGCYSGQIHAAQRGISERFVLQEKKGAIAFSASTGLGYTGALQRFSRVFYRRLGQDNYGQSLGRLFKATLGELENNGLLGMHELTQQYSLHGDPALVLQGFQGPDYTLEAAQPPFDPAPVSLARDSFRLALQLYNLGRGSPDSLPLQVRARFPSGSDVLLWAGQVAAPFASKERNLSLPLIPAQEAGYSRILVELDPGDQLAEYPGPLAEANNRLIGPDGQPGLSLYFFDNDLRLLYPPDFGIVGEAGVELVAGTADPNAPEQPYRLQLDTTPAFDSPFRRETTLSQAGGLLRWRASLPGEGVYYWRAGPAPPPGGQQAWRTASFWYRPAALPGWNQSHYGQLQANAFGNIRWDAAAGQFAFLDDLKDIRIIQGTYPNVRPEVSVNNVPYRYIPWDQPIRGGIQVTVLDPVSLDPWINQPGSGLNDGSYGSDIPFWASDYGAFPFRTLSTDDRLRAIAFLDSIVPAGHYVILITVQHDAQDYDPEGWLADSAKLGDGNLVALLERQGATLIRELADPAVANRPYYLFYKKDDPGFEPREGTGPLDGIITRNFSLPGSWDEGWIRSVPAGPARRWGTVSAKLQDAEAADSVLLELYGRRADRSEQLLWSGLLEALPASLEGVSADSFPFLHFRLHLRDTLLRTAPQLAHWRISYEGLPELAWAPQRLNRLSADSVLEGAPLAWELAVENVSDGAADSVWIVHRLSGQVDTVRLRPLAARDTARVRLEASSLGLTGKVDWVAELNPGGRQPERDLLNNRIQASLRVLPDRLNPLLDVTFDGRRILDGELISPQPEIAIRLRDENPYRPLNDTALFQVLLRYPGETQLRSLGLADALFQPAGGGGKNQALLVLQPELPESGEYRLVVQARDAGGNASGDSDYRITFRVERRPMLSRVLPYPNPFSTATRFVYTLTGLEVPADYRIQVFTISGRLVRELGPAELGPLRIGTHRTDGAWDGTDTFGDRLANGVYLYRVLIEAPPGAAYEHYATPADRFFEKGFGKVVILR